MKFTKEEAFETIKSMLTDKGKKLFMSERSINEQLETLMPLVANEEMELADFVDKVYKSFEIMNLNANNDQSTFVREWKEQNPTPKPAQTQQQQQATHADENNRKAFEEMRKQIDELIAERDNNRKEMAVKDKRNALKVAMKNKGIKDEQWIVDYANEIFITEDMDVEAKADSALKIYNRVSAMSDDPATPHASTSHGKDPNKSLEHVATYMKARREERESINQN